MIQSVRNFLGLYSIVTGGSAVLSAFISFLIFIFLPELEPVARILLVIAAVLLALFVVGAYSQVRNTVLARQTRYGTNTGVMIVAFVGIAVILNALSAENHTRMDTTAGGQYTLSLQTINVIKSLEKPVKVTGFFTTSQPLSQAAQAEAENLLAEYKHQSSKISFEMVDFEQSPGTAREFEVRNNGTLVFESEDRRERVLGIGEQGDLGITEQNFTGAILKVTGKQPLKIYFLTGHGEREILNSEMNGYSFVREGLTADNYAVESLNLAVINQIPSDASLLVLASPQRPFLENEASLINAYLDQGGNGLFLLDPKPRQEMKDILARWGIMVYDGKIVDQIANVASDMTQPAVVQRSQYADSPITKEIAATFFPDAVGLTFDVPDRDADHIFVDPLAITSPRSYIKAGGSDSLNFEQGADMPGPVALALTVEANNPVGQRPRQPAPAQQGGSPEDLKTTRLAVFADSDYATNQYFYSLGNSDLLLNSVNWLTQQEQLISIRPKPPQFRRLVITQREWNFILYSTIAFWPLAVLFVGGVAWWRRR